MKKTADEWAVVAEVAFEEPPYRVHYDWVAIAAQVKTRPMEWAKVFEGGRTAVANAIRQGTIASMHPDLGFEVRTANNVRGNPRTCDLYVRYNPDKEDGLKAVLRANRVEKRNKSAAERDA